VLIKRVPLHLDAKMYSADWDVPRSAGVHLMQIVELMEMERCEVLGIPAPNKGKTQEELNRYAFGGFMFEHAMAYHIIEVECQQSGGSLIKPGEFFWCARCDEVLPLSDQKRPVCLGKGHTGIFATPDALRVDTWRLKEWKFTWKSLRRAGGDEDKEYEHIREGIWRWPIQTMSYCHLVETTGADQEVFFVNGDYTDRTPQLMRYEMDFTPRELRENWAGIVSTARREGWI
jgi:hypothetical protein